MIVNRDDYDRRRWSELFKREPRDKEDFYSLTRKKALRKISEEPFGYTVFNDYSSTACCAAANGFCFSESCEMPYNNVSAGLFLLIFGFIFQPYLY